MSSGWRIQLKIAGNKDGVTAFHMDIKLKWQRSPTLSFSKYASLIHIMKVHRSKVYFLIGSGGKKVKSIIEESGVETIDMQDDGTVR